MKEAEKGKVSTFDVVFFTALISICVIVISTLFTLKVVENNNVEVRALVNKAVKNIEYSKNNKYSGTNHIVIGRKTPILSEVVQNVIDGVVHLQCPQWQGSAFVIDDNLLMTARHCVEGVEDFIITTNDGHKLRATRAISSKNHDIAFIYIDDLTCISEKELEIECNKVDHKVKLKPLKLGSVKDCVLGQEVFAIGSPYGKINFNALSSGIVSGLGRDWDFINPWTGERYGWAISWTTTTPGHPGNSGCPVFTLDGRVRGVLVGGFSPVLICCMPVDIVLEDIEQIKRMFTQDKYEFEEEVVPDHAWYNYKDDTENYNIEN